MKRFRWLFLLSLVLLGCLAPQKENAFRYRYRYDGDHRLVESTAPDGATTSYAYDRDGHLVSVKFNKGKVEYGYGEEGLLWTKDGAGSTEYFRDARGRVVDLLWKRAGLKLVHLDLDPWGGVAGLTVYRVARLPGAADEAAKQLKAALPANAKTLQKRKEAVVRALEAVRAAGAAFVDYSVRYQRDIAGRLTAMDSRAGRVTFQYDDNTGAVERHLPNGIRTVWQYDADGRLEHLTHLDRDGGELGSWRYEYNAAGAVQSVVETLEGRRTETRTRYDEQGVLREVFGGGPQPRLWQYDPYGREVQEGDATLEWDRAGRLAARTAKGVRVQFEYDGRNLPIRATAGKPEYRYRWDTEARLEEYGSAQDRRHLLPDLTGTSAAPWMMWSEDGSKAASYYSDGSVYAEVGANGEARYLLRDGLGRVRLTTGQDGRVAGRNAPRIIPAGLGGAASFHDAEDNLPADLAEYAASTTAWQNAALEVPELRGWLYNTKVQNYVGDFLKSTVKDDIDYVFKGISNDWSDAWKDTRELFPTGRGW
ncbi:MAG: hypothetical protein QM757_26095 [Paludibaculum sp.]